MNRTESGTPTISARELREILFYLENQKTTVEDLRHLLFEATDQDKQVEINHALFTNLIPAPSKTRLSADEEAKVDILETIADYVESHYATEGEFQVAVLSLADDYASNLDEDPYTHYRLYFDGFYAGLWADFTWEAADGSVKIITGVTYPQAYLNH